MKTLASFIMLFGIVLQLHATDMNDVIRLCQGAINHPENELMYKACSDILKNIEENKTKNQFSCECRWTTQMTPVNDGKLCEYRCNCECEGSKKQTFFNSIVALSQERVAGEMLAYNCQGQELLGLSDDTPEWKKTLIGAAFKVKSELTTIKSDLKNKIDQSLNCSE